MKQSWKREFPDTLNLGNIEPYLDKLTFEVVYDEYEDSGEIYAIAKRDPESAEGWVVVRRSECLAVVDDKMFWANERLPSNRTEEFKAATRFSLERALELIKSIDLNKRLPYIEL